MSTEYGRKIAGALAAVRQLHSDTSKMLVDFDKKIVHAGWISAFDNTATRDLTYQMAAQHWMAKGVFRYYWRKEGVRGLVRGLTVRFFSRRIEEPVLLVAEMHYRPQSGEPSFLCQGWDLWKLYFESQLVLEAEKVVNCGSFDSGRIKSATMLATLLYQIRSIEDVESKLRQVTKGKE
jgi:hypothetical protein